MSEEQQKVLDQFKEWIQTNKVTENPWLNDVQLLKFCRARNFDMDKVIEMFKNYIEYRNENDLDNIVNNFVFEKKNEVNQFYPRGYCGVDKIGRPIYIERSGQIKPSKIWPLCDEETLFKSYYQSYEVLIKQHFMVCSYIQQKQIQQTFSILDMTGFSISMMNKQVYSLVQKASKISQDYYPEQLGQLMICNAPMLFTGVWTVIKVWLDERTREKIQILGGGYTKKLLEYVDEDQLIDFLGGKNTAKLEDDQGPWNDYEIVDGAKPDDVVGIKKKGEDAVCFTPGDLLKLPNYKQSTTAQGKEEESKE